MISWANFSQKYTLGSSTYSLSNFKKKLRKKGQVDTNLWLQRVMTKILGVCGITLKALNKFSL